MQTLIIDDHPLVADAVGAVLKEVFPDACVSFAASGEDGLEHIELNPDLDLVILDMILPGLDGLAILHRIRGISPAVPVVMLSGEYGTDTIRQALRYGAAGFIPKTSSRETMLNAFRLVAAGDIYVPPEAFIDGLVPLAPESNFIQFELSPRQRKKIETLGLTPREAAVLVLLLAGHGNKQIGRFLDVREATVKSHVTRILRALESDSRAQVIYRFTRGDLA